MDQLVSEATALARDARYTPEEIDQLLTSDLPGNRVVGLAATQTLGDPASFDPVLEAITKRIPKTPFEQYQALRALNPFGRACPSPSQIVRSTRLPTLVMEYIGNDTSRSALAQRLARSLAQSASAKSSS